MVVWNSVHKRQLKTAIQNKSFFYTHLLYICININVGGIVIEDFLRFLKRTNLGIKFLKLELEGKLFFRNLL